MKERKKLQVTFECLLDKEQMDKFTDFLVWHKKDEEVKRRKELKIKD